MIPIDYSALIAVPGAIQGFRVESPSLPPLGWLPNNGGRGRPAVNTDAEQAFTRPRQHIDPMPYPTTVGYIMGLLPMSDIWRFGANGLARLPAGPYTGGDYVREQGNTGFGVESAPMNFPKLLG